MLSRLKRYSMALLFLFLIIFLMALVTLGVKSFGDKMLEGVDVKIEPRGEKIKI